MAEGLLTSEEVEHYLDLDRDGVERLIQSRKLTAYKLGGAYLRFSKDQVMALRMKRKQRGRVPSAGAIGRIIDFWRYNGFYFVCVALLIAIIYFALQ